MAESPSPSITEDPPFALIGPLEADVLAAVWHFERATVQEVCELLREHRSVAYATVSSVIRNLVVKELLTVERSENAYVYAAAVPRGLVVTTVLESIVRRLLGGESMSLALLLGLSHDLSSGQVAEMRSWLQAHFDV